MKMRVKDFEHYELDGEAGTLRNIETGNYLPRICRIILMRRVTKSKTMLRYI